MTAQEWAGWLFMIMAALLAAVIFLAGVVVGRVTA